MDSFAHQSRLAASAIAVLMMFSFTGGIASAKSFEICNHATKGKIWAQIVYDADDEQWSRGYYMIDQGSCKSFDHDGQYFYYRAANKDDKDTWSGNHKYCAVVKNIYKFRVKRVRCGSSELVQKMGFLRIRTATDTETIELEN